MTPSYYRQVASIKSVPNLQTGYAVRPYLGRAELDEIGPNGEIHHATLGEDAYQMVADTHARMFGVTRKDLLNDAISAVGALVEDAGRGAAYTVNAKLWTAIIGGTSAGYFASGNSNIVTGAGSALSMSAFGTAMKTLRQQTDSDGKPVYVQPGFLAVPPALEATARSIINSTELSPASTGEGTANPWRDAVELIVEPRLSTAQGGDDASWYIFAQPGSCPSVLACFLNGQQNPTVEEDDADFSKLGKQWRCYLDFGIALADPRGAVLSVGA